MGRPYGKLSLQGNHTVYKTKQFTLSKAVAVKDTLIPLQTQHISTFSIILWSSFSVVVSTKTFQL